MRFESHFSHSFIILNFIVKIFVHLDECKQNPATKKMSLENHQFGDIL